MNGDEDRKKALARLYHLLDKHFDAEYLTLLAYDLGLEYDNLRGERKVNKARDLVDQMERNGRIPE
jgi:hypothetical protein